MKSFLKLSFVLLFIIAGIVRVNAQAKNAIGFGVAFNVSKEKSTGIGGILQGEIKLSPAFSLAPSIGVENPYVGFIALGGRYYINPELYANIGGYLHIGGDDLGDTGPGGTAGIGFILSSTKRSVFDLNFHADLLQLDNKTSPLAGIRLTYNFSFSKLAE